MGNDSGQSTIKFPNRPLNAYDLWFFTDDNTHKIDEIAKDNRVCAAYAKPASDTYVSISGRAEVVRDPAKMEELQSPVICRSFIARIC